jgi:hypothetical protein
VRRLGKQLDDFLDNLGQMKSNTLQFELAGLNLRKIQNIINNSQKIFARTAYGLSKRT